MSGIQKLRNQKYPGNLRLKWITMVLCHRCWISRFVEQSKRNLGWTMVERPKPQVSRRNSAPVHFSKCVLITYKKYIPQQCSIFSQLYISDPTLIHPSSTWYIWPNPDPSFLNLMNSVHPPIYLQFLFAYNGPTIQNNQLWLGGSKLHSKLWFFCIISCFVVE